MNSRLRFIAGLRRFFGLGLLSGAMIFSGQGELILNPDDIFVLPYQKEVVVMINLAGLSHLEVSAADQAARKAVDIWNQALGGRLQLKPAAGTSASPRNEMFITIEPSSNPALFKSSGNELAYTSLYAIKSAQQGQVRIQINNAEAKSLSTQGAVDDTYDFGLVLLHEIGHALGLGHAATPHYPPLMSAYLGTNKELNQWTKSPIPTLRHLHSDDEQLLQAALDKTKKYDFAGIYEGSLSYSLRGVGRTMEFKDFKIVQDLHEVKLEFAGNTAAGNSGTNLYFLKDQPMELTQVKGWVYKLRFKKAPDGIEVVEYSRELGGNTYTAAGSLKKVR